MAEIEITEALEKELNKTKIRIIPTAGFRNAPKSYSMYISLASFDLAITEIKEAHSIIRTAAFRRLIKWMCESVDVKLDFNMMRLMGTITDDQYKVSDAYTVMDEYIQNAESIKYLYNIVEAGALRLSRTIILSFCASRGSLLYTMLMKSIVCPEDDSYAKEITAIDFLRGLDMIKTRKPDNDYVSYEENADLFEGTCGFADKLPNGAYNLYMCFSKDVGTVKGYVRPISSLVIDKLIDCIRIGKDIGLPIKLTPGKVCEAHLNMELNEYGDNALTTVLTELICQKWSYARKILCMYMDEGQPWISFSVENCSEVNTHHFSPEQREVVDMANKLYNLFEANTKGEQSLVTHLDVLMAMDIIQRDNIVFTYKEDDKIENYTDIFSHFIVGPCVVMHCLAEMPGAPKIDQDYIDWAVSKHVEIAKYDDEGKVGHIIYKVEGSPEFAQIVFEFDVVDECLVIKRAAYVNTTYHTVVCEKGK